MKTPQAEQNKPSGTERQSVGAGIVKALRGLLVPVLAVLTAIILGGFVIAFARGNPFDAYLGLISGAFGSAEAISETTVWATPYIFAGLAVAVAFKGGLFNIGAEGQLAFGAVASALVGYGLPQIGINLPASHSHPSDRWRRCPGWRHLGWHSRGAQSLFRRARGHQYHHDELHRLEPYQLFT